MTAIVVGAGLAGLSAAGVLRDAGIPVTLFDKGRSPGGRMATRRIGAARFDHGAQFFTVREPELAAMVERWTADRLVREWCSGFGDPPDGHPRYVVDGGMNALAKHLAVGLDVRCNSLAFGISRSDRGWRVTLDDATTHDADVLVVTCPLPQTFSLLVSAEVQMPEALWRTDYERTLSLLAVLDRPSAVTGAGGVQSDPNFTFVGDNQRKGISDVPAITCHANPAWSAAHWDDDPADALAALTEMARPWLGEATIVESQLKRWRFATPMAIWHERCWQPDGIDSLAVAGDAFAGPRVEGAILSGRAAGRAVGAAR